MVHDTPVRRYGGLKDQDRTFTNAHCRHDHGIKDAMAVFPACPCRPHELPNAGPLVPQ